GPAGQDEREVGTSLGPLIVAQREQEMPELLVSNDHRCGARQRGLPARIRWCARRDRLRSAPVPGPDPEARLAVAVRSQLDIASRPLLAANQDRGISGRCAV